MAILSKSAGAAATAFWVLVATAIASPVHLDTDEIVCPHGYVQEGEECAFIEMASLVHKCARGELNFSKTGVPFCLESKEGPTIQTCAEGFRGEKNSDGSLTCVKHAEAPRVCNCPEGYAMNPRGNVCVRRVDEPAELSCPTGQKLRDGQCETFDEQPVVRECTDGFELLNGRCQRETRNKPELKCSHGYTLTGHRCKRRLVTDPTEQCPRGSVPEGSKCRSTRTDPARRFCAGEEKDGKCFKVVLSAGEVVCRSGFSPSKRTGTDGAAQCERCHGPNNCHYEHPENIHCPPHQWVRSGQCARKEFIDFGFSCTDFPGSTRRRDSSGAILCDTNSLLEPRSQCAGGSRLTREKRCLRVETQQPRKVCSKPITQKLVNGMCIDTETSVARPTCPAHFERVGHSCRRMRRSTPKATCRQGHLMTDNKTCRFTSEVNGCSCPVGFEGESNGPCRKRETVEPEESCPAGSAFQFKVFHANVCVTQTRHSVESSCPRGFTLGPDGCTVREVKAPLHYHSLHHH